MKIDKLLFLLFIILYLNGFSQKIDSSNLIVQYKVTFISDTLKMEYKKEELTELLIGYQTSIFRSSQKAVADSLARIYMKSALDNPVNGRVVINTSSIPSAKFRPEVYKNENSELIINNEIGRFTFDYKAPQTIIWKLQDDEKQIESYLCKKAEGVYNGRKYTVWYTNSLSIPEGPYVFKGLPGLVLEAYDEKQYFNFTMVGLKKVRKPIIKNKQGILTEYKKFAKRRKERMDDPLAAFHSDFGKPAPKSSQERIIRNVRSYNCFLD